MPQHLEILLYPVNLAAEHVDDAFAVFQHERLRIFYGRQTLHLLHPGSKYRFTCMPSSALDMDTRRYIFQKKTFSFFFRQHLSRFPQRQQ